MVLAGLSIMTGILARYAAWSLTVLLMSFGIFVWGPSLLSASHQHNSWAGSAINLGITAAAWMVAELLSSHITPAHGASTMRARLIPRLRLMAVLAPMLGAVPRTGAQATAATRPIAARSPIRITWLGHAGFELTSAGERVC